MAGTTNRHELRRLETRARLREVAVTMFVEHGFDAVTVADIAASAGVTERTFYRHFPTKEAVLFGDYDHRLEWLAAALALRPETETLLESFAAAVRSFPDDLEIVRQGALLRSSLISAQRASEHLRVIQAAFAAEFVAFARRRLDGLPDADLLAAVAGSAFAAANVAAIDIWGQRGCVDDIDEIIRKAHDVIRRGLALPEGDGAGLGSAGSTRQRSGTRTATIRTPDTT